MRMEGLTDYDAIIVGAGHNGLVCAGYLARAGLRVLVLERRDIPGGACVTEELIPEYRFSTCSYLCYLLQDKVIEDLELRKFGFEVKTVDPWRFLPLPDGRRLLLWNDVESTQLEIARFSTRDALQYPRWNDFWRRASGILHPYFLRPPPRPGEIEAGLRKPDDAIFYERLLRASMREVICEFFETEPVRAAFVHAHDVGDPSAPGSAWLYAYIKCSQFSRPENVGLVTGGMGGITRSLAASARASGAVIRTQAGIEKILIEDDSAAGVVLDGGDEIRSRVVISNADPKRTFLALVGAERLPAAFADRVRSLKTNAACFKLHAALDGVPDFSRYFADGNPAFDPRFMAEVKICPSMDYYSKAWTDAQSGEPSREAVMEVQMPSAYDPGLAPSGKHLLSIWALYAPVQLRSGTWDSRRVEIGNRLIATLARYAPDLRERISRWSLFTPADMEERIGLTHGNIRHLDMIPGQFLEERPLRDWAHYRTPIRNLYLCGAGTHPGGEVTGAPGHNAAARVLEDWEGLNVRGAPSPAASRPD